MGGPGSGRRPGGVKGISQYGTSKKSESFSLSPAKMKAVKMPLALKKNGLKMGE